MFNWENRGEPKVKRGQWDTWRTNEGVPRRDKGIGEHMDSILVLNGQAPRGANLGVRHVGTLSQKRQILSPKISSVSIGGHYPAS